MPAKSAYRVEAIKRMRLTVCRAKPEHMPEEGPLSYAHLCQMLKSMEGTAPFSEAKINRWLGWAQCAVVASGSAELSDMKQINKGG